MTPLFFSASHVYECEFSVMNNFVAVRACKNDHSYLSMIAHMSKLTFSKAPIVPLSTACKSASWSSTRIACMQPWKERWEGGNNVWRKYPENQEKKQIKAQNKTLLYIFLLLQMTENYVWK